MQRAAILLILVFFSGTLSGYSQFMFSLEQGRAYSERFSLSHILQAAYSAVSQLQAGQAGINSRCHPRHHHILLSNSTIPEKQNFLSGPEELYAHIQSFPPAFSVLSATLSSEKKIHLARRLKFPLSALDRSKVLKI